MHIRTRFNREVWKKQEQATVGSSTWIWMCWRSWWRWRTSKGILTQNWSFIPFSWWKLVFKIRGSHNKANLTHQFEWCDKSQICWEGVGGRETRGVTRTSFKGIRMDTIISIWEIPQKSRWSLNACYWWLCSAIWWLLFGYLMLWWFVSIQCQNTYMDSSKSVWHSTCW